jgi:hypothetical protein
LLEPQGSGVEEAHLDNRNQTISKDTRELEARRKTDPMMTPKLDWFYQVLCKAEPDEALPKFSRPRRKARLCLSSEYVIRGEDARNIQVTSFRRLYGAGVEE